MPNNAFAARGSSTAKSGPPIRSALFSRSAISAASLSEAVSDSENTDMPYAFAFGAASA